jgi:hypothetical protein
LRFFRDYAIAKVDERQVSGILGRTGAKIHPNFPSLGKIVENDMKIWYYWTRSLQESFIEVLHGKISVSTFVAFFNGGLSCLRNRSTWLLLFWCWG